MLHGDRSDLESSKVFFPVHSGNLHSIDNAMIYQYHMLYRSLTVRFTEGKKKL